MNYKITDENSFAVFNENFERFISSSLLFLGMQK